MTSQTFDYDQSYVPPAPAIQIGINRPGQAEDVIRLTALVDTGSDATLIPIDELRKIGARYIETRGLRGFSGVTFQVDLYLIVVSIGKNSIGGIRAVAVARESEAIIGRDVLNQLIITLDGIAGTTTVS